MQNIGFNDSSYVIKPLQPSSAFYRAPQVKVEQQTVHYPRQQDCIILYCITTHRDTIQCKLL